MSHGMVEQMLLARNTVCSLLGNRKQLRIQRRPFVDHSGSIQQQQQQHKTTADASPAVVTQLAATPVKNVRVRTNGEIPNGRP